MYLDTSLTSMGCLVTKKGTIISDKHSGDLSFVKLLVTSRHIVSF